MPPAVSSSLAASPSASATSPRSRVARIARRVLLVLLAVAFVFAGAMHFVVPQFYEQIIPPSLPLRHLAVILSGIAEMLLGVLVLVPRTRKLAAWGIVLLLVVVFPANIYMAVSNVQLVGLPEGMAQPSVVGRYARLPFQLVFIAWAWLFTRDEPPAEPASDPRVA